jgi:hypothetical protein
VFEKWSAGGAHPEMITEQDIALLARGIEDDLLFARKFSDRRLDLVDAIDALIETQDGFARDPGVHVTYRASA